MEAKRISQERLEAVRFCREFRTLCLQNEWYKKSKLTRIDYAHHMNTNHVYLCKKIKIGSGMSLNHFIRAIQLNIAYQLLKSTNYNMTIVLEQSGFTDKSSFYRSFNERFHCSPSKLRSRYFANA